MRAVLTDPGLPGGVFLGDAPEPQPAPHEALVRVTAFSLNRGELNFARDRLPGAPIGWDVAGTVLQAAADGTGPAADTRVVGFVKAANGWAERVAVPTRELAAIPDGVTDAAAATLPVAGLTALFVLERGERLLGSRVLITGATGGVGLFAVQLARLMGADSIAQARSERHRALLKEAGASDVLIDGSGEGLTRYGPYRLIVDGVGGQLLSKAMLTLRPDGILVIYGITAGFEAALPAGFMIGTGRGRIEGFNLYRESEVEAAASGLERLLALVGRGRLRTHVQVQESWTEVGRIARSLMDRRFSGKAVLHVEAGH
ncbi:MAG: zinc-binding dehydrogenase [Gammaproteobacteria bacterium]